MNDSTIEQRAPNVIDPTTLPRDQRSDFWRKQILAWQRSGLSQLVFCREHNLVPHQFTYWRSKSQPTSPCVKRNTKSSAFIPVNVAAPNSSQLQITLPNGIALTGITDENLNVVQQFIQSL